MPNTENLNLLPDYFGSADQAVLALAASVDTNPDSMLGGFIVFSRGFEHYRISRPASIEGYPWVEFNNQGVLALDPDLDFCGTYCTTDTAGAREIAAAHGEQAVFRNFFSPVFLARMIQQDLKLRACAGYWLAPDNAVLKFRSFGAATAGNLIAQAPVILSGLIAQTRSMRSYIRQVARAGDLIVLQTSHFPGLWTPLGAVPVDWFAPLQSN